MFMSCTNHCPSSSNDVNSFSSRFYLLRNNDFILAGFQFSEKFPFEMYYITLFILFWGAGGGGGVAIYN